MRILVAVTAAAVLAAPVAATAAPERAANVKLVSISKTVSRGGYGVIAVTTFGRSSCTLRVFLSGHPAVAVPGLKTKGSLFGGIIQWRWPMAPKAPRGTWIAAVACGTSGSLRASFSVR